MATQACTLGILAGQNQTVKGSSITAAAIWLPMATVSGVTVRMRRWL